MRRIESDRIPGEQIPGKRGATVTNLWSFRLFLKAPPKCCHRNPLRAFSKDY